MSAEVLIVKNITREGPGIFEEEFKSRGISYRVVDLTTGEKFPSPDDFVALVVLGGPDSANDKTFKMQQELTQITRATRKLGKPLFGACLGLQGLVKANDGEVYPNEVKEIGWRDSDGNFFEINFTREGVDDPLFVGLKSPLRIFHLHGETVRLTPQMSLLATGKFCKVQAVRIGENAYGLQGHIEVNRPIFETLAREDPDLLKIPRSELERDYNEIRAEYEMNGRQIVTNFLTIAGLI